MNIEIRFVDHSEQRYNTVGDWEYLPAPFEGAERTLRVTVSRTGSWQSSVAIAIHELIEGVLCVENGVAQYEVDTYDKGFEILYTEHPERFASDEPGDSPDAPYYVQHGVASVCERLVTNAMHLSWPEHEARLEQLMQSRREKEHEPQGS